MREMGEGSKFKVNGFWFELSGIEVSRNQRGFHNVFIGIKKSKISFALQLDPLRRIER